MAKREKLKIVKELVEQEMGVEELAEQEMETMEVKEIKVEQIPADPLPSTLQLTNPVQIYEIQKYFIEATNKPDARMALEHFLSSQDIIHSLNSASKGYDAEVHHLVLREGWQ